MAWEGSTRSRRLPPDWDSRRRATFRRDRWRCRWTLASGHRCRYTDPTGHALECDHVIPGDDHRLVNLQTLCKPHHRAKTQAEAAAQRWHHRRERPEEPHPGLL